MDADDTLADTTLAVQAQTAGPSHDIAPIERLPDEVLTALFLCLRDLCAEEEALRETPRLHLPEWIPLTWVCRRFRSLCFDYPLLWTHIGDNPYIWIIIFVVRSKQSLLDVYVHIDLHERASLVFYVLDMRRVRTLLVEGAESRMRIQVMRFLVEPAPELAMLSVRATSTDTGSDMWAYTESLDISRSMFPVVPRLHSVLLSGRILSHLSLSSSIISSTLENLDIEGCYTPVELHEILQKLTKLRLFAVRTPNMSVSQPSDTGNPPTWTTLELPYLSTLTLETAYDGRISDLLFSSKVPALISTLITFTDYDFASDAAGIIPVLSALSTLFQQCHQSAQFQSLGLVSRVEDILGGYTVTEGVYMQHSPVSDTVPIFRGQHLSMVHRPHAQVLFRSPVTMWRPITHVRNLSLFYMHICSIMPLANVRTLSVELRQTSTAQEWADVLRPLVRLERIKLIDEYGVLRAILDGLSLTPLVLPALSHLTMCFGYRTSDSPTPLLRGLTGVAKARMKGLSRLHIAFEGCKRYLPELNGELMQFADVTWDNANFFDDGNVEDEEMSCLALISD